MLTDTELNDLGAILLGIRNDADRALAMIARGQDDGAQEDDFDPADARNKEEKGGLLKLTPRGVEVCYRLFDAGKTRYAVASLMNISFGAATHRYHAWQRAGGVNRDRQPLQ